MMLKIIIGVLVLLFATCFAWRWISTRYSLPCPFWLAWMVEIDNPFTRVNRAATIIEHLAMQPGMTVIDIGCGPGRVTIPLARVVDTEGKVVAMDVQAEMLSKVQAKATSEHLSSISFLHAGIGDGTLPANNFDRALLVTVLGEIPDKTRALQEIFSALKPGGILSITEIIFDPHFQGQSTILKLAEAIGFRKKEVFGGRFCFTMHLIKPLHEV